MVLVLLLRQCTKLLIVALLALRYAREAPLYAQQQSTFNEILQSAVSSIVWPSSTLSFATLAVFLADRVLLETLEFVPPLLESLDVDVPPSLLHPRLGRLDVVLPAAVNGTGTGAGGGAAAAALDGGGGIGGRWTSSNLCAMDVPSSSPGDEEERGNELSDVARYAMQLRAAAAELSLIDLSTVSFASLFGPVASADSTGNGSRSDPPPAATSSNGGGGGGGGSGPEPLVVGQLAWDIASHVMRAGAPLLPLVVGFRLFQPHERHGRVGVSDFHLPRGIYRSFLSILVVETGMNLLAMPAARWQRVLQASSAGLLLGCRWDWALFVSLALKWVAAVVAWAYVTPMLVVAGACAACWVASRYAIAQRPRALQVGLHFALAFASLLAINRLSYVALARLTAIQAHQYAYALKRVANCVLGVYRYGGTAQCATGPSAVSGFGGGATPPARGSSISMPYASEGGQLQVAGVAPGDPSRAVIPGARVCHTPTGAMMRAVRQVVPTAENRGSVFGGSAGGPIWGLDGPDTPTTPAMSFLGSDGGGSNSGGAFALLDTLVGPSGSQSASNSPPAAATGPAVPSTASAPSSPLPFRRLSQEHQQPSRPPQPMQHLGHIASALSPVRPSPLRRAVHSSADLLSVAASTSLTTTAAEEPDSSGTAAGTGGEKRGHRINASAYAVGGENHSMRASPSPPAPPSPPAQSAADAASGAGLARRLLTRQTSGGSTTTAPTGAMPSAWRSIAGAAGGGPAPGAAVERPQQLPQARLQAGTGGHALVATAATATGKSTKDITAAVIALSRGAVPQTPLERLEQWKLATAGERRLRKNAQTVWAVILVHAAFMIWRDVSTAMASAPPSHGHSGLTPLAAAGAHEWAADGNATYPSSDNPGAGSGGASPDSGDNWRPYSSVAVLLGHIAHLIHVAYMYVFVQSRISKAEAGVAAAWEECRLLHCRLPGSRIARDEAEDWLTFLKARQTTSTPHWPTRVLSALGVLRFLLPALLAMNPEGTAGENALDALRAVALGGKYVVYKTIKAGK